MSFKNYAAEDQLDAIIELPNSNFKEIVRPFVDYVKKDKTHPARNDPKFSDLLIQYQKHSQSTTGFYRYVLKNELVNNFINFHLEMIQNMIDEGHEDKCKDLVENIINKNRSWQPQLSERFPQLFPRTPNICSHLEKCDGIKNIFQNNTVNETHNEPIVEDDISNKLSDDFKMKEIFTKQLEPVKIEIENLKVSVEKLSHNIKKIETKIDEKMLSLEHTVEKYFNNQVFITERVQRQELTNVTEDARKNSKIPPVNQKTVSHSGKR
ncbi:hypothetical protein SNEBB_010726 [Seison nebaliae]|nr:hypothetical protein SNEBB_010726 [Seison nebaliae]